MRWLGLVRQATSAVRSKVNSSSPSTVISVWKSSICILHQDILRLRQPSLLTQLRYVTSGRGRSDDFDDLDRPEERGNVNRTGRHSRRDDFGDFDDDLYGSSNTSRSFSRRDFDDGGFRPRHGGYQNRRPRRPSYYDRYDDVDDYRPRKSRSHSDDFEPSNGEYGDRYQGDNRRGGFSDFKLRNREWSSQQLTAVEKNFYVEHESVAALSEVGSKVKE